MGATFEVNTPEEMCNNKEPEQWWIFTFGGGHAHPGRYVKIRGSYGEARKKMFDKYGDKWCFQYSEEKWEEMKNDPDRRWPMETELEVIG